MRVTFDKPVSIHLGRQSRMVKTILDADRCLHSAKWPRREGPMTTMALRAIAAAKSGYLTPAEAREAFTDAAIEAHILEAGDDRNKH